MIFEPISITQADKYRRGHWDGISIKVNRDIDLLGSFFILRSVSIRRVSPIHIYRGLKVLFEKNEGSTLPVHLILFQ
ncbi:hypothetical protein D3C73_924110 [compost metagenome]